MTNILKLPNRRYILHEVIGQGGMGIVHRATDRLTGEIVALKQVHLTTENRAFLSGTTSATENDLRLALAQEFQFMAGLRHPYIISVLDYGFGPDQQPFFTMPYLDKAETIIEAGARLGTADKLQLLRQLLQALAYLHQRGIIHRDLKPSNVLVSAGNARVLDFGLSKRQDEIHASRVGSLFYMAPEVLDLKEAAIASDLYAVGVIAYELFAGCHPFDTTRPRFVERVINQPPDLQRLMVEQPLGQVIGKLLAKSPEDRYPNAKSCLKVLAITLNEDRSLEDEAIRESYLKAANFVGREAELNQLKTALSETRQGLGTLWLIGSESGVGKSLLVEELRIHALVDGWQVLTG
ncbi:MAG: serine/threonine-protein kinase, partial [Chloroflexota bacterium]